MSNVSGDASDTASLCTSDDAHERNARRAQCVPSPLVSDAVVCVAGRGPVPYKTVTQPHVEYRGSQARPINLHDQDHSDEEDSDGSGVASKIEVARRRWRRKSATRCDGLSTWARSSKQRKTLQTVTIKT